MMLNQIFVAIFTEKSSFVTGFAKRGLPYTTN